MNSFFEQWTKSPKIKVAPLPDVEGVVASCDVLLNGVHTTRLVSSSQVISERFSGLKPSDFALSNIIACGATESLREVHYSTDNVDSDISAINRLMDDVDAIDSLNSQNS